MHSHSNPDPVAFQAQIEAGHAETRRIIASNEAAIDTQRTLARQRRRDHARKWTWLYVILFGILSVVVQSCHLLG